MRTSWTSRGARTRATGVWRAACGASLAAAVSMLTPSLARAQRGPTIIGRPSTAVAAAAPVVFVTDVSPGAVATIPRSRQNCAPGVCFSTFVTVKANAAWTLQVKLAAPTPGYLLRVSSSATPHIAVATPTLTGWVGAGFSGAPTGSQTVEVTYYGTRVPGPGGRLPTAGDVPLVVQYQLVRR